MSGREELIAELIDTHNKAFNLIVAFENQRHRYGETVICEAEADILECIGSQPGITITEMASILWRTPSACSQIVRKLKNKGWVEQRRNPGNNRVYNLFLTEQGMGLYGDYLEYQKKYRQRVKDYLNIFTEEELENYLRVQKRLNEENEDTLISERVKSK